MSKYIIAVIIAIMAISGCSKDTKEQDKQNVAVSEAQKKEEPQQKAAQACVDQRIADFHKDMGADEPIRQDVLGEWEEECGMKASDSSNTQTTVAAVTTTTAPPAPKKVKPGIKIQFYQPQVSSLATVTHMDIIATDDNVSIEAVNINRGNCMSRLHGGNVFKGPYNLKFGEYLRISIFCSNIIEAQITQNGTTYKFDVQ